MRPQQTVCGMTEKLDVDQLGMSYQDLEKAMIDKNDTNYQKYLKIRKKIYIK